MSTERKTPLCPMLLQGWYADMLGHWLRDVGAGAATMEQADNAKRKACSCEGSRCAWWNSETKAHLNARASYPNTCAVEDGDDKPTGRGNCSRTLTFRYWTDPATTKES